MKYVYILKSVNYPEQTYIGITYSLKDRLNEHNSGKSHHTSKYLPWKVVTAVLFANDKKALEFEKYLKSGSGKTFAKRHLL